MKYKIITFLVSVNIIFNALFCAIFIIENQQREEEFQSVVKETNRNIQEVKDMKYDNDILRKWVIDYTNNIVEEKF